MPTLLRAFVVSWKAYRTWKQMNRQEWEMTRNAPPSENGLARAGQALGGPAPVVSPPDQGAATHSVSRATAFLDTFIYPHARIILELAITLKSEKAFKEFTQALMAFLTNAQMVDPSSSSTQSILTPKRRISPLRVKYPPT